MRDTPITDEFFLNHMAFRSDWPIADKMRDLERQLAEARDRNSELQQLFDRRWDADMRAIKMWQEKNPGNDDVCPDHADLVVWLMERLGEATARIAELENRLSPKPDDGWIPWSGGRCPIPDATSFSIRFRSGTVVERQREISKSFYWEHDGDDSDIVAYRVKGGAE